MYTEKQKQTLEKIEKRAEKRIDNYRKIGRLLYGDYTDLLKEKIKVGHDILKSRFGKKNVIPNKTIFRLGENLYKLESVEVSLQRQAMRIDDFLNALNGFGSPFQTNSGNAFLYRLGKNGQPLQDGISIYSPDAFKDLIIEKQ